MENNPTGYPLSNLKNILRVTIDSIEHIVSYEENVTPKMLRTGAAHEESYVEKPKTIVYVPESLIMLGKTGQLPPQLPTNFDHPIWLVNDTRLGTIASCNKLSKEDGLDLIAERTVDGAKLCVTAAWIMIHNWVDRYKLEDWVQHKELYEDREIFNKMKYSGSGLPQKKSGKTVEAESDEATGIVDFTLSEMTTPLALHEFVHTFFQSRDGGNMQAYEPMIEFISLRISGLHERVSPSGGVPYEISLQGEAASGGGMPLHVSRAAKKYTEGSLDDLAVRWVKQMAAGDISQSYLEYSGR